MKQTSQNLRPLHPDLHLTKRGAVVGFTVAALCMTMIVLVLIDIVMTQPLRISCDAALFLEIGRMLTVGKVPYVDFFELNPPLVLYAHSVLYSLTRMIPIPEPLAFNLLTIGFYIISLSASTIILWKNREHPESALFPPLLVSFAISTFFFSSCVIDFGQREHLFVLSFFPYFLIRWLRSTGQPVPAAIGVPCATFSATTACFKPHFLFLVLVFEFSLWLQSRNLKTQFRTAEAVALPAVLMLYGLFLLFMPQNSRDGYFGFVLETYRLGYEAYAASLTSLLVGSLNEFRYAMYLTVASLAASLILARRSTLLMPLAAFTIAGLIIYLIQGNLWVNRAMPLFAGSFMLAGTEIGIVYNSFSGRLKNVGRVAFLTVLVSFLVVFLYVQHCRQYALTDVPNWFSLSRIGYSGKSPPIAWAGAELILNETNEHDPVLFMSTLIEPAYPALLQLKREAASRYLHGMSLTALWFARENAPNNNDRQRAQLLCMKVLQDYCDDIERNKPKLIFVKKKVIAPLIEEDACLKQAFSAYEKLDDIDGHDVYRRRN